MLKHALVLSLVLSLPAQAQGPDTTLWGVQVGSSDQDLPRGIAQGASGDFAIVGFSFGNLFGSGGGGFSSFFVRYDGKGILLQSMAFGGPESAGATGIVPDGIDGWFVGGSTSGNYGGPSAGGSDFFVTRFDSAGNQAWIRQFGTSGPDFLRAVESDEAGGVYAVGTVVNNGMLIRYDGAGTQLWNQEFGSSMPDSVTELAPDGAGGIYLTGFTQGDLGGVNAGGVDAYLMRFDSSGNQLWARQLGSVATDTGEALVADGLGGVYLAGNTEGDLGGVNPGGVQLFVARYDGAGNQLWLRQESGPSTEDVRGAAPAMGGGMLVSGSVLGDFGGTSSGSSDAFVAHYDDLGALTWVSQYGTSGQDFAYEAISTSPDGFLAVGGSSGSLFGPQQGASDLVLTEQVANRGTRYCGPAVPNSQGASAEITAVGATNAASNQLRLVATGLPNNQFGYFLNSMTTGFVVAPNGSQGNLCLGGAIGRYASSAQNSGTAGSICLDLDLTSTPTPTGIVSVLAGQAWNFQAWYRDANPTPTSNFTDGVTVLFD